MFPYRLHPSDHFETFVSIGADTVSSRTTWQFMKWSDGYQTPHKTNTIQTQSLPAQAVLPGHFGRNKIHGIAEVFMNQTSNLIRIEIIQLTRTPTATVALETLFSKEIYIHWNATSPSEYLTWFVADVNRDGILDLVAYTSSNTHQILQVIVFPGLPETIGFDDPIVSDIQLESGIGKLLTASFMKPLYTRQASYTYPAGELDHSSSDSTTEAGILSFFDNFGILGVRMMAPVTAADTFRFEFKGQIPAIAGQLSDALGWKPPDLMGRGEPGEAIGLSFRHDL